MNRSCATCSFWSRSGGDHKIGLCLEWEKGTERDYGCSRYAEDAFRTRSMPGVRQGRDDVGEVKVDDRTRTVAELYNSGLSPREIAQRSGFPKGSIAYLTRKARDAGLVDESEHERNRMAAEEAMRAARSEALKVSDAPADPEPDQEEQVPVDDDEVMAEPEDGPGPGDIVEYVPPSTESVMKRLDKALACTQRACEAAQALAGLYGDEAPELFVAVWEQYRREMGVSA